MDIPKKRVAAKILKCGVSRVRILDTKAVDEALTRQDLRNLIRKGAIAKVPKKGTSKAYSRKTLVQKKKGLRTSIGSRKGTWKTRNPSKQAWIDVVRPLRKLLKSLRKDGKLEKKDYKNLYKMVKGGTFRSKGHLLLYIKERELFKTKIEKAKPKKKEKTETKTEIHQEVAKKTEKKENKKTR